MGGPPLGERGGVRKSTDVSLLVDNPTQHLAVLLSGVLRVHKERMSVGLQVKRDRERGEGGGRATVCEQECPDASVSACLNCTVVVEF